jgi:hypothetical protein
VVTSFKNMEDYVDTHYIVRSTIVFLPSELRKMRARCLSGNELGELMIWVILLTSTRQYLRAAEVLTLRVEQFKMSYAKVSEEDIKSFLMCVCGKRDRTNTVNLQLWTDPECPEFSAATAISIWIAITGIESGYIFPPIELLRRGSTESQNEEHYDYRHYLEDLIYLTMVVAGRSLFSEEDKERLLVGTHAGRKTGAGMAAFGFLYYNFSGQLIAENTIFQAALRNDLRESTSGCLQSDMRHDKSNGMGSTMIYVADSATLYAISRLEGNGEKVSTVLNCLCLEILFFAP